MFQWHNTRTYHENRAVVEIRKERSLSKRNDFIYFTYLKRVNYECNMFNKLYNLKHELSNSFIIHKTRRPYLFYTTSRRIIGKTGRHASCRNLFKDLNIRPLPYLYISKVVCCVKLSMEKMKYNEEVHDQCTRQKSDLHT
jgi:hypothetical protein